MIDPAKILAGLPVGLRDPLVTTYQQIAANYVENRWEPSELNGGKFCEVVHTIIDGSLKGAFAARPSKPKDMLQACRALEQIPPSSTRVGDRSLRILIPRTIPALYEIRNNRGVGHVGGDVDPNFLDATAVYGMASWMLAELIRVFHGVSTKDAQAAVNALVERKTPLIWQVEDIKRVLDSSMSNRNQILLLLHQHPAWVAERDLLKWIEYSNPSVFRKKLLIPLHKERIIEYDQAESRARISPIGLKYVEQQILRSRIA